MQEQLPTSPWMGEGRAKQEQLPTSPWMGEGRAKQEQLPTSPWMGEGRAKQEQLPRTSVAAYPSYGFSVLLFTVVVRGVVCVPTRSVSSVRLKCERKLVNGCMV